MKKRILFPLLAVLLAFSAAFATEALKDNAALFSSVEYKSGGHCVTNTSCSTDPTLQMCSNTFKAGTNCSISISSWLIE